MKLRTISVERHSQGSYEKAPDDPVTFCTENASVLRYSTRALQALTDRDAHRKWGWSLDVCELRIARDP